MVKTQGVKSRSLIQGFMTWPNACNSTKYVTNIVQIFQSLSLPFAPTPTLINYSLLVTIIWFLFYLVIYIYAAFSFIHSITHSYQTIKTHNATLVSLLSRNERGNNKEWIGTGLQDKGEIKKKERSHSLTHLLSSYC